MLAEVLLSAERSKECEGLDFNTCLNSHSVLFCGMLPPRVVLGNLGGQLPPAGPCGVADSAWLTYEGAPEAVLEVE